jgi:hypothetical protein
MLVEEFLNAFLLGVATVAFVEPEFIDDVGDGDEWPAGLLIA